MLRLKIHITGKEGIEIDMPENPTEVTLSQYTDYQQAFEDLIKWREENDGENFNSPKYRIGEAKKMLACLSAFSGMPYKELADAPFEAIQKLFSGIYYAINQYKKSDATSDYWFNYKGDRYALPTIYRDAITSQERFAAVSTAKAVEVLTKWDVYQNALKAGTVDSSFTFSIILLIIATFAEKAGDVFPDNDSDIEKYLSDRVVFFKDIDMQVGLDVLNFFFGGTKPTKQTTNSAISLSRPKKPRPTSTKRRHLLKHR